MTTTMTRPPRGSSTRMRAGIAGVLILALAATIALITTRGSDMSAPAPDQAVTAEQLEAAAATRIFFGHQSVGGNILDAVPGVFAVAGVTAPAITTDLSATNEGGVLLHATIGMNTDPISKIEDFDRIMRSGLADNVDVALMKLCYIDIVGGTDVQAVFDTYQRTLAALEADFPDVTFIHVTTPLTTAATTNSRLKATAKRILGRASGSNADNVAREQYNQLMRAAFGDTGRVFDLAAVQSTAPDGSRVTDGDGAYALAPEFASDPGHLNSVGGKAAAAALLQAVAATQGR